jgi:hypothetical protein
MGRVIVLNDAARAVRPRSVLMARQRHQLQLVAPCSEVAVSRLPSTADRVEKVVWVAALWALFIAYVVVLTPPDFGRSVVRFQSRPIQVASPSASKDARGRADSARSQPVYAANR